MNCSACAAVESRALELVLAAQALATALQERVMHLEHGLVRANRMVAFHSAPYGWADFQKEYELQDLSQLHFDDAMAARKGEP